ncbi:MAG: AmmeMemoRadiSam system protein B [Desulfovibrionaceae bacterium]
MNRPRTPCVAGRFYPGTAQAVAAEVASHLSRARQRLTRHTILAMVPHAGWVFSGGVCGRTLGRANLAKNILLLGPKHTPHGAMFSVWSGGEWLYPGGAMDVNEPLREALLAADPRLRPDRMAHTHEHSLEVVAPFLTALDPDVSVVPLAIWHRDPEVLCALGSAIGRALAEYPEPVSMVVSSDMNHMLPDDVTRRLDKMAIEAALSLEPMRLFQTVREHAITMCGVAPMTVALAAARELGALRSELVAYATSGKVTGDKSQVVGYAGILID